MLSFLPLRTIQSVLMVIMIICSFSVGTVQSQQYGPSIAGDELCGKWSPTGGPDGKGGIVTRCGVPQIGVMMKKVLVLVVSLGLPLLVVFVIYRFITAWFALEQGNAGAYKEALKQSGNAIIGFFFVVALFGGLLMVVLKYFGVKDQPLQLLKLFSEAFVTTAYAQQTAATGYLPNFLGSNNLMELILAILRLVMRFFVYPMLIVIWVWTGFAFVMAQGAPEALNKAKKWLMWAFVTTLVIFMIQAFMVAAQGTVQKIFPGGAGGAGGAASSAGGSSGSGSVGSGGSGGTGGSSGSTGSAAGGSSGSGSVGGGSSSGSDGSGADDWMIPYDSGASDSASPPSDQGYEPGVDPYYDPGMSSPNPAPDPEAGSSDDKQGGCFLDEEGFLVCPI